MLPTLTAVLAGAIVAGAATAFAAGGQPVVNDPGLQIGLSDKHTADIPGNLVLPPPVKRPSDSPATPAAPAPRTTKPTTTTTTTKETPAPPPPETTTEETEEPSPRSAPGGTAQDQVVSLVNSFRADAGCAPLKADGQLTAAAQAHAEDMSNRDYFSHDSLDGRTFDQRIRNAGYERPGAENIARGASTAEQVMQMWMDSEGHRRNILNCDLSTLGVGLDRDGFYWVQDFGY